jgi:hypothetical protein
MENWTCIHKDTSLFNAEVMKGALDAEQIPCVIVNKQDTSYLTFGYIELHVQNEYVEQAKQLLEIQ